MGEIIHLHIGQAGIQMGDALWNQYCHEHKLNKDGSKQEDSDFLQNILFEEVNITKWVPRAVFMDLEQDVCNEIRKGSKKDLFNPSNFITAKECAANNYNRAAYTIGKSVLDESLDQIRKQVEKCQTFQGFINYHSINGGTGSGFNSVLQQRLSVEYGKKKSKFQYTIFPSPQIVNTIVEPYNAILSISDYLEHINCCVAIDNEACYNVLENYFDIELPNFSDINRLIASVSSNMTLPSRSFGDLNANLDQIQTNLVMYPRLCHVIANQSFTDSNLYQISQTSLESKNQLLSCNLENGNYYACSAFYRGDLVPYDIYKSIWKIKDCGLMAQIISQNNGIKVCANQAKVEMINDLQQITKFRQSLMTLSNHTTFIYKLNQMINKFNLMYQKRAFVHWYVGEGLSEGFFSEAIENCYQLMNDYIDNQDQDQEQDLNDFE